MCFYYQLSATAQQLENRYDKKIDITQYRTKRVAVAFEYPQMPVILANDSNINFYHWGIIPYWAKDISIRKYTLNARIESLSEKVSYKNIITKRCLIPATGFYEWKWIDHKGTSKEKYFIHKKNTKLFSFAGLYATWRNPENNKHINTFTILTTKANTLMSTIHNTKHRMPVILKQRDEKAWLDGKDYRDFAYPYQIDELTAKIIES